MSEIRCQADRVAIQFWQNVNMVCLLQSQFDSTTFNANFFVFALSLTCRYAESRFAFWQNQNITSATAREVGRVTTGRVYWWSVFDLFLPHWHLHAADTDCVHYCYVIGPFDAATERLTVTIEQAEKDAESRTRLPPLALPEWKCN
jgi:hypothetical protein